MITIRAISLNDRMASMEKYLLDGDDQEIGIFWYLPSDEGGKLIGVYKIIASSIAFNDNNLKVYPYLHKKLWAEVRKQYPGLIGNYTSVRRGRVSATKNGFELWIGSWYNDYKDEIDSLIKEEFNLQQFTVVIDSHWDIGNGWDD